MDEFMRVMMRIGQRFEDWSCLHVNFDLLTDVWPYLLEDRFGEACLNVRESVTLAEFDDDDCLSVAFQLRLPVIVDGTLPVPVDERAENPVVGSPFKALRIQTVRDEIGEILVSRLFWVTTPVTNSSGLSTLVSTEWAKTVF